MERTKDLRNKLLGVAGAVVMMCFMFVQLSITTWAAEGKVTAQAAKIRASASTTSEQVGSAVRGETYTITGEETGADGYVWYKITFDGNKSGYVRSDLMQKSGEVTNTGGSINPSVEVTDVQPISATITGSSVRVRSDASTNGTILAGVVRDSVVTITGQAKDTQNKTWYRVTFSSENGEVTGFIREDFLSVSGTVTPVVDAPVVNDPVVNDPVVNDPVVSEPGGNNTPALVNDYETIEDGDVWYLVDNTRGQKYKIADIIKSIEDNPKVFQEYQEKVNSQKTWIVILVIIVVALGIAVTLLFLKVKEVMDEAYFTAVEKETIRQRQGQKAGTGNGNSQKTKQVMHTVGAANGTKQGVPKATSVPKPSGNSGQRPAQQKPSGAAPQTVKVSNPAETRAPKPVGQQQRPAGTPGAQKPAGVAGGQRPSAPTTQQKPVAPAGQQAKPAQQRPAEGAGKQAWQSKNFMTEEDDDFEFEFLNWDGNDEN